MDEANFLLNLAIRQFNFQYGKNYNVNDFCLFSIQPSPGFEYGYEINTIIESDTLRMKMYLTIGDDDLIGPFKLEVTPPYNDGSVGDELYVCLGQLNKFHKQSGRFSFEPIDTCGLSGNLILDEEGNPLETEDGFLLVTEDDLP